MTTNIELRIPNEKPYHGVARLVVGGLAARLALSFETLEDLQLALASVLEADGYAAGDEICVALDVTDDRIQMSIGPLRGDTVRADLDAAGEETIGLGRLLGTLVENVEVEKREDGDWLRFTKAVRGLEPIEDHA
ncbi:MAG: hypothetical protein ABI649_03880 [Gaiellaceae bacterium]